MASAIYPAYFYVSDSTVDSKHPGWLSNNCDIDFSKAFDVVLSRLSSRPKARFYTELRSDSGAVFFVDPPSSELD